MHKSRIIVVIGVIIALLPMLGFPHTWESFFQVVAGLAIVLVSFWANIDRRLTLKAKAQRRQEHKRREIEIQNMSQTPQVPESSQPITEQAEPFAQQDREEQDSI